MPDLSRNALQSLMQQAAHRGLLIEAGWVAMRMASVPHDATTAHLAELRAAFYAGATHLFAALIEPTATDVKLVAMIQSELHAYAQHLKPPRKHRTPHKMSR